jgi:hypothetical protein
MRKRRPESVVLLAASAKRFDAIAGVLAALAKARRVS